MAVTNLEQYLMVDRCILPGTAKEYGIKPNGVGIIIPMTDGGETIATKVYTPEGEPKIKWGAPLNGTKPPIFPSPEVAQESSLIVEGEFDAVLAAQELGLKVASGTTGAKQWQDNWSKYFSGREVTILYDNDSSGHQGAEMVAQSLYKAGASPRIAKWPEDKPTGYDVTDFFREGGDAEVLRALIEAAEAWSPPGISVTSRAFLRQDIRPPKYLINMAWPEEGIGFVAGPPKSFKSFITLDMAFAISTGKPFLGKFKIPETRKVLLIQQESSLGAFQARVRQYADKFGETDNLYIISNKHFSLEDDVSIERLESEIEKVKPSLVILDPLASFIEGDENSASEMGAVIRLLRRLRDTHSTGFAVVHHSSKAGSGGSERGGMRMRGSSAFYAAAEAGIWVERTEDEEALRSKVRIELKEAEGPDPFLIEMDPDNCGLSLAVTGVPPKAYIQAEQVEWEDYDDR